MQYDTNRHLINVESNNTTLASGFWLLAVPPLLMEIADQARDDAVGKASGQQPKASSN